jgi:hypothetical protein
MHNKSLIAVLSATCAIAFGSVGRAEEITTVESTTTTPAGSSMTIRSTTEGNPADAVTLGRRTLIVPTGGPVASNSSSSSVTESTGLGNPVYIKRVSALREQLNNAISKGWLTGSDVTAYQSRLDDLSAKANAVDSSDGSSNSLEKQINEFNIEFSSKIAGH